MLASVSWVGVGVCVGVGAVVWVGVYVCVGVGEGYGSQGRCHIPLALAMAPVPALELMSPSPRANVSQP